MFAMQLQQTLHVVEVGRAVALQTHAGASWVRLSRNAWPSQILVGHSDCVVSELAVSIPKWLITQSEVYPARILLWSLRGKIRQPLTLVLLTLLVPIMPVLVIVALGGLVPHFDIR